METLQVELKSKGIVHGYLHADHEKRRRAVLIFPGGGYTHCSPREGKPVALAYMEKGYQAFVLDYTAGEPPQWESVWENANEAVELLFQRQGQWSIKFEELSVVGFSAGGHLAGTLAASGRLRPAAVILCYPAVTDSFIKERSPKLRGFDRIIDENTPPVFVFSTFEDYIVPVDNTICLLQALKEQEIPFEAHIFQWGHHGLSLALTSTADGDPRNIDDRTAGWFALSISWLNRLFEKAKPIE